MKPFSFYLITDTHYFENSLGASGREYDAFMRYEQKCFAETQAINESVFNYLENAEFSDTVLIAGDLSFSGEKESHLGFIRLLRQLKKSGKRVLVITADHDFNKEPWAYSGDTHYVVEGTDRSELYDLYYEFGFDDAIAVDKEHLSYVSQLSDGVRLLALNNDYNDDGVRRFDESQREWIKIQCEQAKKDGQLMIAMCHYPLLAPNALFSLIKSTYQSDGYSAAEFLASCGVKLVFTGHTHIQSVNSLTADNGNMIYDICTGSVIADPAVIRYVELKDEHTARITSIKAPDFVWNTDGRLCEKYLADMFDSMILNIIHDMQYEPARVLSRITAPESMKPVLKLGGRILSNLTVGRAGRILFVKVADELKSVPLTEFAAELVRRIFEGNPGYDRGTPRGDAVLGVFKRLRPILNRIKVTDQSGKLADLYDMIVKTVSLRPYDDWNCTLNLK